MPKKATIFSQANYGFLFRAYKQEMIPSQQRKELKDHSLKINELNQSSQAGVIFFNSTPAKNTNF